MEIRKLKEDDFNQWLSLWEESCFHQIDRKVTNSTWQRICDSNNPINGLCAVSDDGTMLGIIHFVVHNTTGYIESSAYMQDIFVVKEHRRKGIAVALLKELENIGKKEKWIKNLLVS